MDEPKSSLLNALILCVGGDVQNLARLCADLETACDSRLPVEGALGAREAERRLRDAERRDMDVALIVTENNLPDAVGAEWLLELNRSTRLRRPRKVLIRRKDDDVVLAAAHEGAVHGRLRPPWSLEELRALVGRLLTEFYLNYLPDALEEAAELLDARALSRAYVDSERERERIQAQLRSLHYGFIGSWEKSDDEVSDAMIRGFERALVHVERRRFEPGDVLLSQGERVPGILVLLSGDVEMIRRDFGRESVVHPRATGRIVGLMALAHRGEAFLTCRATTKGECFSVSWEQLDALLPEHPDLAGHFTTSLMRSLATRNRRATELRMEVESLNDAIARERDHLADALSRLESAQARLVEAGRMATLGELSAGIAHELNNPIASILRSADFAREDVLALIGDLPDREGIREVMLRALESRPLSPPELREARNALAADLGDRILARRLVNIGLMDAEEYRRQIGEREGAELERRLERLERYHQLGVSLRNLRNCGERVTAIVKSLRSYARADGDTPVRIDLREGIEDTLLLLGHHLDNVRVVRDYGDAPPVECFEGQVNQVWTNLFTNALHAMKESGELAIALDAPDPGHVRVRITDNGPGIPSEHLERVFDPRFTTKGGRVKFGLGMGLSICRQIVNRHHGELSIESTPGRTRVTVVLPVDHPPESAAVPGAAEGGVGATADAQGDDS